MRYNDVAEKQRDDLEKHDGVGDGVGDGDGNTLVPVALLVELGANNPKVMSSSHT